MKNDAVINNLEKALIDRAQKLAKEYLSRAERARQHVIEEAQEKLHLREQREVLAAQAEADRFYRRRIQANELQLKGKLDQLRWNLIQSVVKDLQKDLEDATRNQESYSLILQGLLSQGAGSIESDHLVAEFNKRDLDMIGDGWEQFIKDLAPGKKIDLHPAPHDCTGGVLICSHDNRIRVDNTFEGRVKRFSRTLQQVITEHLFAREVSQGGVING